MNCVVDCALAGATFVGEVDAKLPAHGFVLVQVAFRSGS